MVSRWTRDRAMGAALTSKRASVSETRYTAIAPPRKLRAKTFAARPSTFRG